MGPGCRLRARFRSYPVLRAGGLMNNRFASLMAAGFVLAAGSHTLMSAAADRLSPGNVDIVVGGAPQPQYAQDGRRYVEAQNGRAYAIRLRNPYGVAVP